MGIRAHRVDEIWHIDITEFKLKGGGKAYLQVTMDNYSRKIINWKLSQRKGQALTVKNLKEVIEENKPESLISDGGGENIGDQVKQMLLGKNIIKKIAKKDIVFSNSMVESFFNVLKKRFINKFKLFPFSKLFKKITRAVILFNGMPTPSLSGATPSEVYNKSKCMEHLRMSFTSKKLEWKLLRSNINRDCFNKRICSIEKC